MFVMGCYGHKLSNGVLFAHHLILGVPGGSSHLAYRRRVPLWHNPPMRVKVRGNLRWNLLIGYKVYGPTERPSCAAHVDGLVQV